jgi:hypothetical protein
MDVKMAIRLRVKCHDQVLDAAKAVTARSGKNEFSIAEIVSELAMAGSHYAESTIRTHVVSRCCANAPNHHAVVYDYFERIDRGLYRVR